MIANHRNHPFRAVILSTAALLLVMAGCSKSPETPSSSGSGSTASSSGATGGESLFSANGCGRCHALNGSTGGRAPDLTHVGADPTHTAAWIADQIKNPKSHNPDSRMPAYQGKMSDQEIQTLSTYLAGMK